VATAAKILGAFGVNMSFRDNPWPLFLLAVVVALAPSGPVRAEDAPAPPRFEGPAAFGDWRRDVPGAIHRIAPADLPAPYATKPTAHVPRISPRPVGAVPKVPEGFKAELYAEGLTHPRLMRVAPNGDVLVSETAVGRIRIIRAGKSGGENSAAIFATVPGHPFGLAFYPPGPAPRFLYVATTTQMLRYAYAPGDVAATGPPEVIVDHLPGGGHTTRDIAFSPDGKRMFVSVGSGSNVAEQMGPRPPGGPTSLGAAWGNETNRAAVLAIDPDGKNPTVFATGLRNCAGLATEPATGDPWCAVNERDMLGDDLVPDYVARVREGAFYGWPWLYIGTNEDPRQAGQRPDLAGKATLPDVLIQPHSAPIQMSFYTGTLFPPAYVGNAFVALHGSWNRSKPTGYKVIRIVFRDGKPTGAYEDFITGFALDDDHVWGRPAGVTVTNDGALLVSDDANGFIWRVTPN